MDEAIPDVSVAVLFSTSDSKAAAPLLSIALTTVSEPFAVDVAMVVNVVPFGPARATLTTAPIDADVVSVEPTPHFFGGCSYSCC
ncbi:hypothetical protein V6N13_088694 [Hibiscus sabdariffa]|uniref:Secreted protein n=1 Tax=Hibiscus sabdariffa TaxID=183260 RepID=A0ABR2G027_9ROSI